MDVEHVVIDNLGWTEREKKNPVCRRRHFRAERKKKEKKKTLSVDDGSLGRKKKKEKRGPVRRGLETSISGLGFQNLAQTNAQTTSLYK
jgi:hypothetical protein